MMKKTAYFSTALFAGITLVSTLFKVMHWPGANIGLTLGIVGLTFIAVPSIAVYKYRAS